MFHGFIIQRNNSVILGVGLCPSHSHSHSHHDHQQTPRRHQQIITTIIMMSSIMLISNQQQKHHHKHHDNHISIITITITVVITTMSTTTTLTINWSTIRSPDHMTDTTSSSSTTIQKANSCCRCFEIGTWNNLRPRCCHQTFPDLKQFQGSLVQPH